MKRQSSRGLLMGVLLSGVLALPVTAQHQQHHQAGNKDTTESDIGMKSGRMHQMHRGEHAMMGQGNMQDHMRAMHQMMSHPVMRTMMMTTAIPAMKDTLGLSQDQIRKLDATNESLQKKRENLGARLDEVDGRLKNELGTLSDSDSDELESLIRERAVLVADHQALALTSAVQMHGVLTENQQAKLASMDAMQMHRHLMSSMSHEQMMSMMHGGMMSGMGCPMMTGEMMGGVKDN